MLNTISREFYGAAAVAAMLLTACGDSGPTGQSPLPPPAASSGGASSHASPAPSASPGAPSALGDVVEEFNCNDVDGAHVRFGPPGFVEDDRVGLFVLFEGVPRGPKRVRVWWDYENDFGAFRDFVYDADATVVSEVYEHRYLGLTRRTEMLVRVELILDGLTGNCARNRRVSVVPSDAPPAPSPGPTTQTAQVGPPISAVDSNDFNYLEGVRFTVLTSLTIDSVWVNPAAPGILVINLWDDAGTTLLNTTSIPVSAGSQQIPVGFNVPPGDYLLCLDNSTIPFPGVGMTWGGSSFPYQIPGVIQLTDTTFYGGSFGLYYYLYDWQVTW